MRFILLLQLLVAMGSAAVISDSGGLYSPDSLKPNEDTVSKNAHYLDEMFIDNSDISANYPQRSKWDGHISSNVYVKSKRLPVDIDQLYDQKSQASEMVNLKTDDLDGLYSYNNPDGINYPHHARNRYVPQAPDVISKLLKTRNSAQDIGQLYGQKSPASEMMNSKTDDLDGLYSYNNHDGINYPHQARKRTVRQAFEVISKLSEGENIPAEPTSVKDDKDTLNLDIYNTHDGDKYPPGTRQNFAYVSAVGDVNGGINIDSIRKKNLQILIKLVKDFNTPGFNADKFYNDLMDLYHRTDLLPINAQVQPASKDFFIDAGELYHQNGIPRDETTKPTDIDNLYQYNGNYPVYPKH